MTRGASYAAPAWLPDFAPAGAELACREPEVDPDWFFPQRADETYDQARQVCRRCPVQAECADWAIRAGVDYGMWGGHTPEEIKATRRRRRLWT